MEELDQFTVERLERIIRNAKGVAPPTYFEVNPADIEALARIALAAKTAEPVAWWTGPEPTLTGEIESIHDHETGGHYLPLISISTTSEAALSRERFIFKVANFLCTRRQSIAREAETASMIYDMVNTQVTERQKKSIRDGISELRSNIESLGGFNHDAVSAESSTPTPNSPEIPDGWKLVPIELTAEMAQAARDAHEGEAYLPYSIYRAMLSVSPLPPTTPDGWVACRERLPENNEQVLTWNGQYKTTDLFLAGSFLCNKPKLITHWMPLPAAPKPEK